jgi:hypothetical protein
MAVLLATVFTVPAYADAIKARLFERLAAAETEEERAMLGRTAVIHTFLKESHTLVPE